MLAQASGYKISTYWCHAGPSDRPFEECHVAPSLAIVREGRFTYRGVNGKALLQPGSILLGNRGACYECSHEDSHGDICTAIHFEAEVVAEAAHGAGLNSDRSFRHSAIPPLEPLVPAVAALDRGRPDAPFDLLDAVTSLLGQKASLAGVPSAREQARLRRAIDLIENHYTQPLSLEDLASAAAMSKYHFLRSFRRVYGTTPYRYLQARRLAQFASRLDQANDQITTIALDCGFTDISTFNARFKAAFGQSPTAWRSKA